MGWALHHGWGQGSTLTTPVTYRLFQSLLEDAQWCIDPTDINPSHWRQLVATFPSLAPDLPGEMAPSALSAILISEGWSELLRVQSEKHPLLLLFDDIQWADQSSLDLLRALSQSSCARLMVVLAWRSEDWTLPEGIRLDFEVPL